MQLRLAHEGGKKKKALIKEGENLRSKTCNFGITESAMEGMDQNEEMEDEIDVLTLYEATQALLGVSTS